MSTSCNYHQSTNNNNLGKEAESHRKFRQHDMSNEQISENLSVLALKGVTFLQDTSMFFLVLFQNIGGSVY